MFFRRMLKYGLTLVFAKLNCILKCIGPERIDIAYINSKLMEENNKMREVNLQMGKKKQKQNKHKYVRNNIYVYIYILKIFNVNGLNFSIKKISKSDSKQIKSKYVLFVKTQKVKRKRMVKDILVKYYLNQGLVIKINSQTKILIEKISMSLSIYKLFNLTRICNNSIFLHLIKYSQKCIKEN